MSAKIINFPVRKELSKKDKTRKENLSILQIYKNFKSFEERASNKELAKEMFTPDYFMLVE